MTLALFIKKGIQFTTAKHAGIISLFDKEFVLTNLLDRKYSKAFHKMFDRRLEFDYKDFVIPSVTDAQEGILLTESFIDAIDSLIK